MRNLKRNNDQLNRKLNSQSNHYKTIETNWKTEREALSTEKDDWEKANLKLQHQVTQYQHELKKNEQAIEKLKDQIKK